MITRSFYFGLDYLENDQPHFKVLKHAFFTDSFSSCDMICFFAFAHDFLMFGVSLSLWSLGFEKKEVMLGFVTARRSFSPPVAPS